MLGKLSPVFVVTVLKVIKWSLENEALLLIHQYVSLSCCT